MQLNEDQTPQKKMKITIYSYKKAQSFKKDYVRLNGDFLKFEKESTNHSTCNVELKEGDELDARASKYRVGTTKWDSSKCQSWSRLRLVGGELKAFNFKNEEVTLPIWVGVN